MQRNAAVAVRSGGHAAGGTERFSVSADEIAEDAETASSPALQLYVNGKQVTGEEALRMVTRLAMQIQAGATTVQQMCSRWKMRRFLRACVHSKKVV